MKPIYITLPTYILCTVLCLGGLIFSRDYIDRYVAHHDLNQEATQTVDYSLIQYFTLGFDNMLADILLAKSITAYPIMPDADYLEQHNSSVEKARDELQKNRDLPLSIKEQKIYHHPKDRKQLHRDKTNGRDEDGHDHNSGLDNLLLKLGFYLEDPEANEGLVYTDTLITNIYKMYDLIVSIDPAFYEPYSFAFSLFSLTLNHPELTEKLTLKGLRANPSSKPLSVILAMNAIFFDKDIEKTKSVLAQGQKVSNPENALFLAKLIITLDKSNNPFYIKAFLLKQYYDTVKDQSTRRRLETLMLKLALQSTRTLLNQSIPVYESLHHTPPGSAMDIVAAHILDNYTEKFIEKNQSRFSYRPQQGFEIIP